MLFLHLLSSEFAWEQVTLIGLAQKELVYTVSLEATFFQQQRRTANPKCQALHVTQPVGHDVGKDEDVKVGAADIRKVARFGLFEAKKWQIWSILYWLASKFLKIY